MGKKRYTPEQIVAKLRQAEVELAKGQATALVCRKLSISEQSYYRWRREYGGLTVDQAKRLKDLEKENARLKKLVVTSGPPAPRYNLSTYNRASKRGDVTWLPSASRGSMGLA
jgi:transposase-like protein